MDTFLKLSKKKFHLRINLLVNVNSIHGLILDVNQSTSSMVGPPAPPAKIYLNYNLWNDKN